MDSAERQNHPRETQDYSAGVIAESQKDIKTIMVSDIGNDERLRLLEAAAERRRQEITQSMAELLGDGDITKLLKDSTRFVKLVALLEAEVIKSLAKTTLDNWLRDASTRVAGGRVRVGPVRPEEVLKRFEEFRLRPEVIEKFFHVDAEAAAYCDKFMTDMESIVSVKRVVKYLSVLASLLVLGAVSYALFGPMAGFVTILCVLVAELVLGSFTNFVNRMADHDWFWNGVSKAGRLGTLLMSPFKSALRLIRR